MSDFRKNTPQMDAALNSTSGTPYDIVERIKAAARAGGQPAEPSATDVHLSESAGYRFEKEIRFAESTGRRSLLIRANSESELNELEAQILGYKK
jgi:hypothetical protein